MSAKKTCFVITGFGPKSDPNNTGRIVDLDKTFENLIKPVFDELDIECFRAKEIRHTGIIDVPMYEWIYKADIVVADVSTLNPNALYELGVRHALRPNTTIVISEDQTNYPFDINHTLITQYEHLGKDIGVSEAKRFKKELTATVKEVLKETKNDSPVYTYLPKLQPPKFTKKEIKEFKNKPDNQVSLSELIDSAEEAKNKTDFYAAQELYKLCLKFSPNNIFLIQRLSLVTYKGKKPNPKSALFNAEKILKELNPDETTDIETLGLSGAINKRLFEIENATKYLDKAIKFYAKGYYIGQDYYNAINYAFLLTLQASKESDKLERISIFRQSQRVREEVVSICLALIKSKEFEERDDKEWIYQSLAQAYLGLDKTKELDEIINEIDELSKGTFDKDTFTEQNQKLVKLLNQLGKEK